MTKRKNINENENKELLNNIFKPMNLLSFALNIYNTIIFWQEIEANY